MTRLRPLSFTFGIPFMPQPEPAASRYFAHHSHSFSSPPPSPLKPGHKRVRSRATTLPPQVLLTIDEHRFTAAYTPIPSPFMDADSTVLWPNEKKADSSSAFGPTLSLQASIARQEELCFYAFLVASITLYSLMGYLQMSRG